MAPPTALDVQSISDTQIATFLDRLSVNGVSARRSKAPKMGGGIAAHASSDMFKSPVSTVYLCNYSRNLHWSDWTLGLWETEGEEMGSYVPLRCLSQPHESVDWMVDRLNEESSSRQVGFYLD